MFNSRNKSNLADANHTLRLLTKINALFTQKASRLVFGVSGDRYSASACTGVTITPSTGAIEYTDPQGNAKSYVLTDVLRIERLRNKKYRIEFKA